MRSPFLFALLLLLPFSPAHFQKKPWPVPDAAKNKKNPVPLTAESIAAGKTLWGTHCKSCHGVKGMGDGPKSAQLNTPAGDFSAADVQAQTDGSLFYKTAEGRDDMPSFKKKIPDADDIWNLVNYIRTLKKGGAVVTPAKDPSVKKPDPPVVKPEPAPVKKDTVGKKDPVPVVSPKPVSPSLQDQINLLAAKVDSLGREVSALKAKLDSTKH